MSAVTGLLRGAAVTVAIAAVVDPAVPLPARQRPSLLVRGDAGAAATIGRSLASAGFDTAPQRTPRVTVLATDRVPERAPASLWVVDTSAPAPNVRITAASIDPMRLPGQAVAVMVSVDAKQFAGQTTELTLEDHGVPVATARHQWKSAEESWEAHLQYLPPDVGAGRLRVRAARLAGDTRESDNEADVAVPAVRGPIRTLVVEASVTWPALFVRRALEGEPAFAVSAVQRATKNLATRAGAPPGALTPYTLRSFEVVVAGGPASLSAADVESLRWFVESRGGVVVFVPDDRPSGRYLALAGLSSFEMRQLDAPVKVGAELFASELAVAGGLAPDASVVAADPEGGPVVFAVRRGAGAVVFSGALDAWRQRGRDDDAFARFWRRTIARYAAGVPPEIEVAVDSAIARPGDRVMVTARVRDVALAPPSDRVVVTGLEARAVSPESRRDEPIRLWPTAEPGVFAGEWHPAAAGMFDIAVTAGGSRGDTTVTVAQDAARPSPDSTESLKMLASAAGGRAFALDRTNELVAALAAAYPAERVIRSSHVMRSPWWCVPFAALLCGEWVIRRRRGLS